MGLFRDNEPAQNAYDLGRSQLKAGEPEQALEAFERCLEFVEHPIVYELIGESLCKIGRYRDAVDPLVKATQATGAARPPCLLAEAFEGLGQWLDAYDAATEAIQRDPLYRRAKEIRARVEARRRKG